MSDDVPCLLMMNSHNNIVVPGIIGTGNKSFIHISELGWLLAELGEQVQRRQQPSQEGRRCQLHSTPNSNILVHTSIALYETRQIIDMILGVDGVQRWTGDDGKTDASLSPVHRPSCCVETGCSAIHLKHVSIKPVLLS